MNRVTFDNAFVEFKSVTSRTYLYHLYFDFLNERTHSNIRSVIIKKHITHKNFAALFQPHDFNRFIVTAILIQTRLHSKITVNAIPKVNPLSIIKEVPVRPHTVAPISVANISQVNIVKTYSLRLTIPFVENNLHSNILLSFSG